MVFKQFSLVQQLIFLIATIQFVVAQLPASPNAKWDFSSSGPPYADIIGGGPNFLLNGLIVGGISSRPIGNGIMFEGNNLACTDAPSTNFIGSSDFIVDIWVYVNIIESQSRILCQIGIDNPNHAVRFCIGYDTSEGWNHLTVQFAENTPPLPFPPTTTTDITCWIQTDSTPSTASSTTSPYNDVLFPYTLDRICLGASLIRGNNNNNNIQKQFTGIVGEVKFYKSSFTVPTPPSNADLSLVVSTSACNTICSICKPVAPSPYACLQSSALIIQNYDFKVGHFPLTRTHQDLGPNNYDLFLLDPNSVTQPVYTPLQGLYFDNLANEYINSGGDTTWGAGATDTFTIEMWIKPNSLGGPDQNLFEKRTGVTPTLQWGINPSGNMYVNLPGFSKVSTQTITASVNTWTYVALRVARDNTRSQVCFKINTQAMICDLTYRINAILTESGTSITRIGSGFKGFMSNVIVYDYAMEELDLKRRYQVGGCLRNAVGNTCNVCPIETQQCLVDCNFTSYVNISTTYNTCTLCFASCRSCWGAHEDECFSCVRAPALPLGIWKFDYDETCKNTCGDRYRDDYEDCEDGNVIDGDGCGSTCLVEPGYLCAGGSFHGIDTCYDICGDGRARFGKCDDGNTASGDGCDSQCNVETGFSCTPVPPPLPIPTPIPGPSPQTCNPICGDGIRVGNGPKAEGCDDGARVNGDGCDSNCKVELGWNCTGGSVISKDTCVEICGDGRDFGNYQCDDGNFINNDGCDQNCMQEVGWTCTGGTTSTKDTCTDNCGDGRNFHQYPGSCDDGNRNSQDGCDSNCNVEIGFKCSGGSKYTRDVCTEDCGDARNWGVNGCDDGNLNDGDGCHSDCTVEIGYDCVGGYRGNIDACHELCGDGRNFGTYQCDDGNLNNGDGCNSLCQVESQFTCTKGDHYTKSYCTPKCTSLNIRAFYEMCDDGNLIEGDGCDFCCKREMGFKCTGGSLSSQDTCTEVCGDGRNMNIYQCDDGNNLDFDGCSATCQIELGYQCTGGTLYTPDDCKEICGDGKNFGQHQCDDGNLANNDGCSSQCFLEQGFTCTPGGLLVPTKCTEICGDGKHMGTYDCDDGNTVDGDGCSSKCVIETGYNCSQGNFYIPDLCYELCGDGLNMGKVQCDDGNNLDGDGCSGLCTIEDGYNCTGGTPTTPDNCFPLSDPSIVYANFSRDNKIITLEFNETVFMLPSWNTTNAWFFEMFGPSEEKYNFTWNVTKQSIYQNPLFKGTTQILVDFYCDQQFYGNNVEKVVITFIDRNMIQSSFQKVRMLNESVVVYPYGQEEQGVSDTCGINNVINVVTQVAVFGSFGFGFIGAFLGYSMVEVWIMMLTIQYIYLFPTINLFVPSCLTRYIQNFYIVMPQSDFIANWAFRGLTNSTWLEEVNPVPSYNYVKLGYISTAFIQTAADILTICLYFFVINVLMEIFRMTFLVNQTINNVMIKLKYSIMTTFVQFAFLKLAFTSHLNLRHITLMDTQTILSSILAILAACVCYVFTIFLVVHAVLFFREIKASYSKSETPLQEKDIRDKSYFRGIILFEDYSIAVDGTSAFPITIFYPCFTLAKALILANTLITNDTSTQMIAFMLMNIISLGAAMVIRPFTSMLVNAQLIFNEMALFLVYLQAHMFIPSNIVIKEEQDRQAQIIMGIIIGMTCANAGFVIFRKATQLIKCKSNARPKPEETPTEKNLNELSPDPANKGVYDNVDFTFLSPPGSQLGIPDLQVTKPLQSQPQTASFAINQVNNTNASRANQRKADEDSDDEDEEEKEYDDEDEDKDEDSYYNTTEQDVTSGRTTQLK